MKKTIISLVWLTCSYLSSFAGTPCSQGPTLLAALSKGKISYVQTEITSLENPNITNKDGISLLMMAAYKGSDPIIPIIRTLLGKKADVNARTLKNTAFNFGTLLSNAGKETTPLMLAAWSGNVAIVELLVKAYAEIDSQDSLGQTALTYAILGHPLWPNCPLSSARRAIIKLLLEHGLNPNIQDSNGLTPLYYYQHVADLKPIGNNNYIHEKEVLAHDEIYNAMKS